jgi:hypothetical protein
MNTEYIAAGDALRYLKQTSPFQEDWEKITDRVAVLFQKYNPGFDVQAFREYVNR